MTWLIARVGESMPGNERHTNAARAINLTERDYAGRWDEQEHTTGWLRHLTSGASAGSRAGVRLEPGEPLGVK